MPREYRYQCDDRSLATPALVRWCVRPLMPFVPRWISANAISIAASLCMYAGLWAATGSHLSHRWKFLLAALCILLYMIGDNADGIQARRLGTAGTPRGEFVDHGLDIFNTGIQIAMLVTLFEVRHPAIVSFFFCVAYALHATIFFEQFRTNVLHFEPIGPTEAMLAAIAALVVGSWPTAFAAMTAPAVGTFSFAELVFLFSIGSNLLSTLAIVRRVGCSRQLAIFWGGLLLLALISLDGRATPLFLLTGTLFAGTFVADLLYGHLVDQRERYPSAAPALLALALLACGALGIEAGAWPWLAAAAWLGARFLLRIGRTVRRLWSEGGPGPGAEPLAKSDSMTA